MPHYVYLIKYIHPTSQQGLTRPAGSPGSSTLLLGENRCLQLDKELKFLWIHRNLPLQPPLVKVCTLLAGHSQGHCVSSLSCAQGRSIKAQMRDWSQTNFYKIQKQHHFTWFLWTWLLWSPRHHALENKAVSALFDSLWGTWGFGEGNLAVHAHCFYSKRKRTFLPAPERVCPQSFSSESSIQIWCTVSCISLLPNSQIHFLPGSGAHLYHSKSGSEAKIWWVMPRPFCCDLTVLRWMKSSGEICSPHRNNCCQRQLSGAW